MDLISSTILAVVEGLTEFLPISSTGHLILVGKLLRLPSGANLHAFEIFIQAGAISAIVILYFQKLRQNLALLPKLLVGFLPAAGIGLLFRQQVTDFLDSSTIVLSTLFVGGLFFLIWDRIAARFKPTANTLATISYQQALLIGFAQSLALVPGVSRAAASIFGGLAVGLEKQIAVEFSFLLAIPTIFAASGLALAGAAGTLTNKDFSLMILGFVVALISALVSVRFFVGYLKKHSFAAFGWYRIILASLYALFLRNL